MSRGGFREGRVAIRVAATTFALAAGLAAAGLAAAGPTLAERSSAACADPSALTELRQHWAVDLRLKRLGPVLDLYTPDAMFFEPTGTNHRGRSDIATLFANITQMFDSDITLATLGVACSGTLAVDQGQYTETLIDRKTQATQHLTGSYFMVLERGADHQWRIASQMWTVAAKP